MAMTMNIHRANKVTIDTSCLEQHGWIDVRVTHELSEGHWVTDEITIHCAYRVDVSHIHEKDEKSKPLVDLKR